MIWRPVTILVASVTEDAVGNQVDGWTELMRTRAEINGVSGKESVAAGAETERVDKTFRVRWCAALSGLRSQTARVRYDGSDWDVVYVDDFRDQHRYLTLRCGRGR